MGQHKIKLSNIRIASPCSQRWEEMVGDHHMRFCSHCQLNVYNFSAMTKVEVESFLMKAEGRVCGRFYQRADGTMLTQDCPVGLRALKRRVSRIAATAFSAIFGMLTGQGLYAQQIPNDAKAEIQRGLRRYDQPAIQGTVYDIARAVIVGATVTAINQQTKKTIQVRSDQQGRFRFVDLPAGEYDIEIATPGFVKFSITKLQLTDDEALTLDTTMKVGAAMGEIVYVEPPLIPTNDTVLPTTLIRKDKPRE